MEEVNEKEGTQGEPAYLAERYSRQARRSLLAAISCTAISGVSLLIMSIFSLTGLVFSLLLLVTFGCGLALFFLPLLAIGYYAQADYYKYLLDGKSRVMRWVYYPLIGFAISAILALLAIFIPSWGSQLFALFLLSFMGALFLAAGHSIYTSERRKYGMSGNGAIEETPASDFSGFTEEEKEALGRAPLMLGGEALALFCIFLISTFTMKGSLTLGAAYMTLVFLLLYHLRAVYREYRALFGQSDEIGAEETLAVYMKYLKHRERQGAELRRATALLNGTAMLFNYAVWVGILYSIKTAPLPVNCAGAWADVPGSFLLLLLVLTFVILFVSVWNSSNGSLTATLFMIYLTFFMAFFLLTSVMAMCTCWNPALITKTYIQATVMFVVDTAVKAAIITGLMNEWAKNDRGLVAPNL